MNKKQKQENTEELEKLKQDFANLENQLKRAVADYHNLERRVSEGRSQLTSFAANNLIVNILPVMDHLEKAVEGVSEEERNSGWFKGVEMSVKQLQQVLKDEGLEQIRADGQFDPTLHEAVDTREPSSAEASAGKGEDDVLEVVRKGYNLNGKVLRPAQVVVGRKQD
ncbi:nucleotide exchange factor GrpE [Candidatus Daviesbacteria bacterium RIFCSPHIGHO2_12_FULL_37_16]|uniref:Protein GrpE n=2 Tax=Candidatus Daviesiibacteriota TaxID=1752718 RepID=A0A1F5K7I7_9BACT|nr:MAG: Protein GrpE [Candidatus Daviesbacteria bacterium GW2011_GWA1_36_8]OGE33132.1 MAG: nucleotide exchange factor GrpE [Candidatus Daviesbacteria bacterium RIFCSPHIGHO2_02_FULL_37_9]OGE36730.1 MAG: nucleotide exchange factor GrpE [Candidatus Daviesbacteria bacterium RIFCSPHIGHO2_12_FULL_37_16]